jgi:hypothetical protein
MLVTFVSPLLHTYSYTRTTDRRVYSHTTRCLLGIHHAACSVATCIGEDEDESQPLYLVAREPLSTARILGAFHPRAGASRRYTTTGNKRAYPHQTENSTCSTSTTQALSDRGTGILKRFYSGNILPRDCSMIACDRYNNMQANGYIHESRIAIRLLFFTITSHLEDRLIVIQLPPFAFVLSRGNDGIISIPICGRHLAERYPFLGIFGREWCALELALSLPAEDEQSNKEGNQNQCESSRSSVVICWRKKLAQTHKTIFHDVYRPTLPYSVLHSWPPLLQLC